MPSAELTTAINKYKVNDYILNVLRVGEDPCSSDRPGPWGVEFWPDLPIKLLNFTRWDMAKMLHHLFGVQGSKGAEIGVHKGQFSELLCQENPQTTVYSIDPWKEFRRHTSIQKQRWLDEHYEEARARLSKYSNSVIVRKTSTEAALECPHNSLDWVYIDGAHDFDNAMMDIILWSKNVKPGGVVAGHDWCEHRNEVRVAEAVLGYTLAYRIDPWFVFGFESKADARASFMWVKPEEI